MADEQSNANEQAKGAPEGVTNRDLSDGHSSTGPKAPPEPSNQPPVKEPTAEEKAATEKEAAEKLAAETETPEKKAEREAAEAAARQADIDESKKAYATYGDPEADAAVNMLKESNVTPAEADDLFRAAVESGDLSKVDVAALEAKVGKDKATLIMAGITSYYNRISEGVRAVETAVFSVVGNKENFAKVKAWANAKELIDPEFKKEADSYRKMFDTNPTAAKLATTELLKAYNADPKNSSLTVTRVDGERGNNDTTFVALSRADYIAGLKKPGVTQEEVDSLNARRTATIRAGK